MTKRDINLLPAEVQEFKKGEKIKRSLVNISLLAFLSIGLLSLVSSALLVQVSISTNSLKKESEREAIKVNDLSIFENEVRRLEKKLTAVDKIIGSRARYSVLLTSLSRSIPADILVTSLATFGQEKVSLSGFSQSYISLSKFITSLLDLSLGGAVVDSVDITAASLDESSGKVRYSLVVHLKAGGLK